MKILSLIGLSTLLIFLSNSISTNNSLSINELHQKSNGSYLIHGTCYSSGRQITISDATGSVSANGQTICYGTYGAARVVKEGVNTRIIKFTPIRVVKNTYRIEKDLINSKALINKNGALVEVKVVGKGFSNYVIETSGGYERL